MSVLTGFKDFITREATRQSIQIEIKVAVQEQSLATMNVSVRVIGARHDRHLAGQGMGATDPVDLAVHRLLEQDGAQESIAVERRAGDDPRPHCVHQVEHLDVVAVRRLVDAVELERLRGAAARSSMQQWALGREWRDRRLQAYGAYVGDIKRMRDLAQRVAAAVGLDDQAPPLDREAGLPLLAEANMTRSSSFECSGPVT